MGRFVALMIHVVPMMRLDSDRAVSVTVGFVGGVDGGFVVLRI